MRSFITLAIIALLVATAESSYAQESNVALSAEAAASEDAQLQRTPALVVHEVALPVQKPAAAASAAPSKKGNTKTTTSAAKTAVTPSSQAPIFMPGQATQPLNAAMGTTGNPKYDQLIAQSAARNGIDPNLIIAVMRQESGFKPYARSYKGATGLMQLMPATAARFGVTNIYDPAQNIEGGSRYLRFLHDTFNGDLELVLAGYNAGENAVVNSGFRIPRYRETQNYVRSITARYDRNRNRTSAVKVVAAPVAPSIETFSNGRLSNNY